MGTLAAIGLPMYQDYIYRAQVVRAIAEIRMLEKEITVFELDHSTRPDTLDEIGFGNFLDPWKHPYQYLSFHNLIKEKDTGHPKGSRKDKHKNPLNWDFDLYSVGKDGESKQPLQNPASWDDVVRASDGQFVGLASEY